MKHGKIYVAGIGPGSEEDITPAVRTAIMQSDVVVGYKYYFNFIRSIVRPETECIDTGMKRERPGSPCLRVCRTGTHRLRYQLRRCRNIRDGTPRS